MTSMLMFVVGGCLALASIPAAQVLIEALDRWGAGAD